LFKESGVPSSNCVECHDLPKSPCALSHVLASLVFLASLIYGSLALFKDLTNSGFVSDHTGVQK